MMNVSRWLSKIILLMILLLSATITVAEQDTQYLLTEKTYKVLSAAQELMATDKNAQAETKLKALLKATESYERAVVQQTLGYLYSSQQDYKKASALFQQALDSNALPKKVSHDLKYNLAQLLIADDQYNKGIALLEQWLQAETSPANSVNILLASAYYRVKNYKKTVEYMRIAIKKDKDPKEAWYQVLLSAHLELKHYKSAIKVLEKLIVIYPYQKTYWAQLSALYLQQNKEFSALAVKLLAQRLELGDAKTLISLVNMYRYLHIPYKSAQLMTNAIDKGVVKADKENLNRLADSWLAAKEGQKAADVLQQVVALDNSGEADLKYGRILFELEQWENAIKPLSKSVQILQDEQLGSASLLLGMAQFYTGDLTQAKVQFIKAVAFENERNQAGQWLRHVEQQLEEMVSDES
ncbi:MAG: tetratricopeptide repeat protein [Methylophagaceae bacterium]